MSTTVSGFWCPPNRYGTQLATTSQNSIPLAYKDGHNIWPLEKKRNILLSTSADICKHYMVFAYKRHFRLFNHSCSDFHIGKIGLK